MNLLDLFLAFFKTEMTDFPTLSYTSTEWNPNHFHIGLDRSILLSNF